MGGVISTILGTALATTRGGGRAGHVSFAWSNASAKMGPPMRRLAAIRVWAVSLSRTDLGRESRRLTAAATAYGRGRASPVTRVASSRPCGVVPTRTGNRRCTTRFRRGDSSGFFSSV